MGKGAEQSLATTIQQSSHGNIQQTKINVDMFSSKQDSQLTVLHCPGHRDSLWLQST